MAAEIESLDRQVAFKESEERRVRAEIAEYQRRLEAVPRLESAWVKLTRDYDTQQLAYRELLTKSTAAQAAVNLEGQDIGERFRIVDPALVPVLPLRSKRLRYNAAGLAFGLFLGVGHRRAARTEGQELLDRERCARRALPAGAGDGALRGDSSREGAVQEADDRRLGRRRGVPRALPAT